MTIAPDNDTISNAEARAILKAALNAPRPDVWHLRPDLSYEPCHSSPCDSPLPHVVPR